MTGSDYRPGLETPFVWKGQSRRNWWFALKVAITCGACIGAGYYVGLGSSEPGKRATAALEQSLNAVSPKKPDIVQPISTAEVADKTAKSGTDQITKSGADRTAVGQMQQSQSVASQQSQLAASTPSITDQKASADQKAAVEGAATVAAIAPAPLRVINAEAEKPQPRSGTDAQEKPRAHTTAPKKKKASAQSKGERERSATQRSAAPRNDAYVPPRTAGYSRNDAYVPPRLPGYRRADAYYPPREELPPPRAAYAPDRYGGPWAPPRYGLMYDDYGPGDYIPRNSRGYLREFADPRD
jgi:hypothetical protein